MFRKIKLRDYDFKLVLMTIALSAVGIVAIGSAEGTLQARQLAGVVSGVVVMVIISFLDYSMLLRLYWLMYVGNLVLLAAVWLYGTTPTGLRDGWRLGDFDSNRLKLQKLC